MTVVDDEVSRLWGLLTELSAQLSANREHCESLKRQCEQLKTQAIHTGIGFTLRRFNTDITKEQFESELERYNATLTLENQALQYENRQLSMLLKDYEGTLDNVMARFRGFAASTQQFELDSAKHYETLLLQHSGTSAISSAAAAVSPSSDNATLLPVPGQQNGSAPLNQFQLQMALSNLAGLLRKALRSSQGEDPSDDELSSEDEDDDTSSDEEADKVSSIDPMGLSDGGPGKPDLSSLAAFARRTTRQASVARSIASKKSSGGASNSAASQQRRKRADSKLDLYEGGYLKLLAEDGQMELSAEALERDTELVRLEKENQELRKLLGIYGDLPNEAATSPLSTSTPHLS